MRYNKQYNNKVAHTRVVMKYDVKKILVPPGDIEFILLKKRLQNFPPLERYSCHVILKRGEKKKQQPKNLQQFTSRNQQICFSGKSVIFLSHFYIKEVLLVKPMQAEGILS